MNITITGDIGSGKSTVAKRISELLNMDVIETGELYRKYSKDKGVDVLTQNKSDDRSIDKKIDSEIERLGKERNNIIFVSRLAWHFVPDAIHIYLVINPILAAKRITENKERVGESHINWVETYWYNRERKILELNRYKDMYGLDDPSGYTKSDIVVVVGKNSIDLVANCIVQAIRNKEYGFFIDPKTLLPTQTIRDFNMNALDDYIKSISTQKDLPYINLEVDCVTYDGESFFIEDGHHRTVAAIKNDIPFIRTDKPVTVGTKMKVVNQYDYEDLANISLTDEVAYIKNDFTSSLIKSITTEATEYSVMTHHYKIEDRLNKVDKLKNTEIKVDVMRAINDMSPRKE